MGEGDTVIERGRAPHWNPLTPAAIAVFLTVLAYTVAHPWGGGSALGVALLAAAVTRLGRPVLALSIAVGLPTFALLFLMNGIVATEELPVVPFGPLGIAPAAAPHAARIALPLAAAIAALGWLVLIVAPRRLARALAERGLPSWAAYLLVASLDAVPQARRRAAEVLEAQRARGLRLGRGIRRVGALLPAAGPLIVSLVSEAEERALALEARGFRPRSRRSTIDPVPDARGERTVRLLLWAGCVLLVLWRLLPGSAS